jgi:hypothetical protein
MKFALVDNDVVVQTYEGDIAAPAPWVSVPDAVQVGWIFDGSDYTAPPDPGPQYRTNLSAFEWVTSWTEDEWSTLKKAAAGEVQAVPEAVQKRLDQLLDAIKLTGGFDVQSAAANAFYDYLESRGFITAQRKAGAAAGSARVMAEADYVEPFCYQQQGMEEVVLEDGTRVDCLTSREAIEVDFSNKWAEAIGQALSYARQTGKRPGVLLIVGPKSNQHLARFHTPPRV